MLFRLHRLPQWAPATLDGQPVPGQLAVEVEISSATHGVVAGVADA